MTAKKEPVKDEVIAEVVSAELVPVSNREGDFISQYLTEEREETELGEGAGYEAIINKIMRATTEDELWSESSADKPSDVYRRRLIIAGYNVVDSDFPTGPPVYFAVNALDTVDNVERVILTGNQKIMAKLVTAQQRGWFPAKLQFIQTNKTNRFGQFIEDLVKWED